MESPGGKQRTREHVIADLSISFVEWQALLCGYTMERMRHDYGIDLEMMTYNERGNREAGTVLFQVKATDGMSLKEGQAEISFRIERANLLLWLDELEPMILIVFDAKKIKAYWLCVQEYFAAIDDFNLFAAGKTITVKVPVANRVNTGAMRRFALMRDQYRKQPKRWEND
jgi:Domain of unknown function (DUF4365)